NFQRRAASIASAAKYLFDPGELSLASATLPDGSTWTFTLTFTLPRIVLLAFRGTLGKIRWTTSGGIEPPDLLASCSKRSGGEAAGGAWLPFVAVWLERNG